MIPARKSPGVEWWFRRHARGALAGAFHRVLVSGDPPSAPVGPLLVCMNHSSWWDLLLAFWLSSEVLGWDSYAPMDHRQLRRYPVLSRIGIFGVDRETLAGAREFRTYARGLLAGQRRVLWVTAQGEMTAAETRPVRLYSGLPRLALDLAPCRVLTLALDYEFWEERRPEAFARFGRVREVPAAGGLSPEALRRELEAELEGELDRLAVLRRRRDAALFQEWLRGKEGVHPFYDLGRRLAARARGEAFAESHAALRTPPRRGPAAREEQA